MSATLTRTDLRGLVDAGRDEGDRIGRRDLAVGIEQLHRQADAQLGGAPERNLDVGLERLVGIERGDDRRGGDAVPLPDRDVAHDACLGSVHPVVLQLDLAFADLRVERLQPRFRRPQRVLGLLELLAADRAGADERLEALDLLAPVLGVGLHAGAAGFRAADGGALLFRVDLDERRAGADAVAGLDEDPRDDAVHLRLDGRRAERADGGDEVRGLLDGLLLQRQERHAGRRRSAPCGSRPLGRTVATAGGGEQARGAEQCGKDSGVEAEVHEVSVSCGDVSSAVILAWTPAAARRFLTVCSANKKGHAPAWP